MNDSVAIGADRAQVCYWVYDVLGPNIRKLLEMVYVDEPVSERTICRTEIEAADNTWTHGHMWDRNDQCKEHEQSDFARMR